MSNYRSILKRRTGNKRTILDKTSRNTFAFHIVCSAHGHLVVIYLVGGVNRHKTTVNYRTVSQTIEQNSIAPHIRYMTTQYSIELSRTKHRATDHASSSRQMSISLYSPKRYWTKQEGTKQYNTTQNICRLEGA